ncbi:putative thioesterase PNKD isoform X1 [Branchiostoma floridae x Branchiostoma japonicum]
MFFYVVAGVTMGLGLYCVITRGRARSSRRTRPSLLFTVMYWLYSKTHVGYWYHRHLLTKAREKYPDGHSVTSAVTFGGLYLKIQPVAIVSDNYSYVVMNTKRRIAVVVDPSDPEAVQAYVKQEGIQLAAVLTTHKHWDHSGGNHALKRMFPGLPIYGSATDGVPGLTNPVLDGDMIQVGGLEFHVMSTPGHTVGHVVYQLDGAPFQAPDSLFTGDLLFIGGCGRTFEGDAATMLKSLEKVSSQSDNTIIWPGHEYTLENLLYGETIDGDNENIREKLRWTKDRRKARMATCPSTVGDEKQHNVFLRTRDPAVAEAVGMATRRLTGVTEEFQASVLAALRERKDKFKVST